MFQVVTNAQWADHIGRPVVFKYPGLAARRAKPHHERASPNRASATCRDTLGVCRILCSGA